MTRWLPAVLRDEPQFRRLFVGMSLSAFGDRITFVALPFAVLAIGGGAGEVGIVAAAASVPFVVFTLAGGVIADRVRRHRLMLLTDLVRLVTQSIAAYLLISGTAEVWHLAVLFAVFGTADAFFSPAVTGLLPLTVAPQHLQAAGGLRSLVMSTGMVLGPAVAGVLIAVAGAGYALAVDAATFAASAAALATLHPREPEPGDPEADAAAANFLRELREGFAEVRSRSWVWSGLIGIGVYHVVVLPSIFVLGPVLAEQELDGASSWAIVTAAFGVGAIVGDLLVIRLRLARPLLVGTCGLAVASCQALIIGSGLPVEGIAALEAVTGAAVSIYFTLWELSLQQHIPERSLSRVSSYDYMVSSGLMPVGLALAGPASAAFGLHATLHAMTIIAVPVALALLAVPAVRTLRAPPDVAPGTA
ncbi:MAG: transporter [Solirubrobacterales bacterium]|nr:transporter [Solirubrobacterales bacterium]